MTDRPTPAEVDALRSAIERARPQCYTSEQLAIITAAELAEHGYRIVHESALSVAAARKATVRIKVDTSEFDAAIQRTKRLMWPMWPLFPPEPGTHESDLKGVLCPCSQGGFRNPGLTGRPHWVECERARAWSRANRSQTT